MEKDELTVWQNFLSEFVDKIVEIGKQDKNIIKVVAHIDSDTITLLEKAAKYILTKNVCMLRYSVGEPKGQIDNHIVHLYHIAINGFDVQLIGYTEKSNALKGFDIKKIAGLDSLPAGIPFIPNYLVEDIKSFIDINATSLSGGKSNLITNIDDMRSFWNAYNKSSAYVVGDREQWYNEVLNINFDQNQKSKFKIFFELCLQTGHKNRLILNLVLSARNTDKNEAEKWLNVEYAKLEKHFDSSNKDNSKELAWSAHKESAMRRKVTLSESPLETKELLNSAEHFKWFDEKLQAACDMFKDFIVK